MAATASWLPPARVEGRIGALRCHMARPIAPAIALQGVIAAAAVLFFVFEYAAWQARA